MTYFTQVNEQGELKLPKAILEQTQVSHEGFAISLQGKKIILSPIATGSSEVGLLYANLSPQEKATEFQKTMQQWRSKHPAIGLTDEQLRREHIYED